MKTLYIECNMGAAGDMLMGALSELIDDADGWTVCTDDGLPSAQWENMILITENGNEILTY